MYVYLLSACFVSLSAVYNLKFTERSHMRERSRMFGNYIKQHLSEQITYYIDTYVSVYFLRQLLVLIDMFSGLIEGLEGHEQLLIISAVTDANTQTVVQYQDFATQTHTDYIDTAIQTDPVEPVKNADTSHMHMSELNQIPINVTDNKQIISNIKKKISEVMDLSDEDTESDPETNDQTNQFIETTDDARHRRGDGDPVARAQHEIPIAGKKTVLVEKRGNKIHLSVKR